MSTETSNLEAQFNDYPDRCDRCSARSQKRVHKNSVDLMFCNHHYNANEEVLIKSGWILEVLTPPPVDDKEKVLV